MDVKLLVSSPCVLRLLSGCSAEGGIRDGLGCGPAAGPPAQPAEHHQRGDPETGPPHPRLPAQSAADPAVCHSLRVHHLGPQGTGEPFSIRRILSSFLDRVRLKTFCVL